MDRFPSLVRSQLSIRPTARHAPQASHRYSFRPRPICNILLQLSLLYANVSPDDILLREELDQLAVAHPNFSVWYTGVLL